MNQMQMMNLGNHISKLWDAGAYRNATQIAQDRLDDPDELEESLAERNIVHRNTLIDDLYGELQSQARRLTNPSDTTSGVQKVVDKINTVQGQDVVWFKVGADLLDSEPISRDDFLGAVESTNELLNDFRDEE